ncbi:MAG TPA: DUF885 family protein [Allosphingosinicella sp.]|jgi:uncharacterized protein (DUF885 family)|nr:DUF885 family protein [Allosphingosinicella sp.]
MDKIDRRLFLASTAAAAALPALPAMAAPARDAATEAMLSGIAEALLAEYPENATALGLDKGARAGLKSRLTDRSLAGRTRHAEAARARLARLKGWDRRGLDPATLLDLEVTETAHGLAADGYRFPYGDMAVLNQNFSYRNAPYVVAQNTGAFVEIPDFLDSNHQVKDRADADAYLARLELYAAALDGETERLRHDSGLGVIAPDFLLDKTLRQMKAGRAEPIAQWGIVTSLAKRTEAMGGNYRARAEALARDKVAPALDRQLAELTRLRAKADGRAGVWKLPDGDAYYAWALRAGTTSNMNPDQVHAVGREQLAALQARMEPILRAQGLTQGSVGERMTALGKDPKVLFPNTDEGRRQILDYLNGRVADMRTRLPRAFATLVRGNLVIKRVPPSIEAGAPDGYAGAGTIDGSVPGNYYINLRDTSIWPRYALPTLTYHEGIPGHVWQGEYTYKLPLIRSLLAFNAYSEGWALYAEQLGDELGAYDGDPLGRLGYLQSLAFRACRLVVDSGIHAKRWTRAQAIQWFATTNGSTLEEVQGEVDRYCAWPGQACGYKVGHSEINRLRDKAKAALGPRFDLRTFDDAVVLGGNVPLTLLERVIDRSIAARRG